MSHTFRKLNRIKIRQKIFSLYFYSLYNSMSQCPIHLENETKLTNIKKINLRFKILQII